jgi:hypothetical protein
MQVGGLGSDRQLRWIILAKTGGGMFRHMAVLVGRLAILLGVFLVVGCNGVKNYSQKLPINFRVKTKVESVSALNTTVAEFDIHRVNSRCETDYLGRVFLDKPLIDVGVPSNELIYLDFIFASKAFLSTTASAIRYQTMLKTRSGYEYQAEVSYLKGIYNVVIREKQRGGSTSRIIERWPLSSCK